MRHIDYVHVYSMVLVSNNKNISKVKGTQDTKLCNLLLRNMGNNSNTYVKILIKLYLIFQAIS